MKHRRQVARVTFSLNDLTPVLDCAAALATTRNGWINIRPLVDPDDAPTEPGLIAGIFSTRGPAVPVGTWVPGRLGRHGPQADSVGLLHPYGQLLARRLGDLGIPAPEGWRVVQDHPRRGLVFALPFGFGHEPSLRWIISACERLTAVPLTGTWEMEAH